MPLPVSVVCDRGTLSPLDLTPRLAEGSLNWSSVVPGGFASCSFQLDGDFRQTLKTIPYLSIIRIIGDSGNELWEGQVEDLSPTLTDTTVGLKVTAMGYQNVLKETTVRAVWSKRDLDWAEDFSITGVSDNTRNLTRAPTFYSTQTGQYDPTDLTKTGVRIQANDGSNIAVAGYCNGVILRPPGGLTFTRIMYDFINNGGSHEAICEESPDGTAWANATVDTGASGPKNLALAVGTTLVRLMGAATAGGFALSSTFHIDFNNIRLLGTSAVEDAAGGFYGDTLIRSLLSSYVIELGQGVIESGSDFAIDHLDASVRRAAADILNEIAAYYSREWAVWENALLDWKTPNLSQHQWIVPLAQLSSLDLDASVVNSQKQSIVLYTDAASGLTAEQSSASTDRRNPYVLNGRTKDKLVDGGTMTSNTAQQLAMILLNDLGFGPVPASGSVKLPGDLIVQHAQGNAKKAWEIRAGDNITIPELPLADIFTQDGRGECLFHIVSAEAETSRGEVTLTLDSYGSKRSDVLMARLAAVTQLLGG